MCTLISQPWSHDLWLGRDTNKQTNKQSINIYFFRYNARGFDINRNFPDYFKQNNKRSQPETEAVKEWISKIQFVLSGNIHGGALVASYPFDNTPNSIFSSVLSSPSLTPDDDVFKHLAASYSLNHARMYLGESCKVL
jgi:carboxypeptidase M